MKQHTGPPGDVPNLLLSWLRSADTWVGKSTGSRRARTILLGSLITLTLAMVAWTVYRNWDALLDLDWQLDLRYLGVSFGFYSLSMSLWVFTWHGIMGRLAGFTNLRQNVRIYLYSAIAKPLPGSIWYAVGSRLHLYGQEGIPKTITSMGYFLEAALTMLSSVLVFLASLPFSRLGVLDSKSLWWLLGTVPLLVVAFQPSLLLRLLNAILTRLGRSPLSLQLRRRDSVRWVLQYAISSIMGGLILYYLAWAIHPLPAAALPGVIGIFALTSALRLLTFFVPGGWGIQEVSLSLSLTPFLPLPIALGVPLLFRLWLMVSELVWIAACYLILSLKLPLTRKH